MVKHRTCRPIHRGPNRFFRQIASMSRTTSVVGLLTKILRYNNTALINLFLKGWRFFSRHCVDARFRTVSTIQKPPIRAATWWIANKYLSQFRPGGAATVRVHFSFLMQVQLLQATSKTTTHWTVTMSYSESSTPTINRADLGYLNLPADLEDIVANDETRVYAQPEALGSKMRRKFVENPFVPIGNTHNVMLMLYELL